VLRILFLISVMAILVPTLVFNASAVPHHHNS
jgi:hypothetical protein